MWRKWLIQVGLWLARHGGWSEALIIAPYKEQIRRLSIEDDKVIVGLQEKINAIHARMATTATVSAPALERATALTRDADTTLSGGEAKRHNVYARLIKDFPTTPRRELALAIELALFHAPKEG